MLEYRVESGDVPVTGEIETYIRDRAAHLDTFYDRILTCRVAISAPTGHHEHGGPYEVHVDLDVPGAVLTVTRQRADQLHVAVRKAFAAAERQLKKHVSQMQQRAKEPPPEPPARVLRLFGDDGYGFAAAPDGREVYFHRNAVLDPGFDALAEGMEVRLVVEQGDDGPQASTVAIVHPHRQGARAPEGAAAETEPEER